MIVFPRKTGKAKKGDSSVRANFILFSLSPLLRDLTRFYYRLGFLFQSEDLKASTTRSALPLPEAQPAESPRKIASEQSEFQAYRTLRVSRANARYEGVRKIRAAKVRFSAHLAPMIYRLTVICRRKKRRPTRRNKLLLNLVTLLYSCHIHHACFFRALTKKIPSNSHGYHVTAHFMNQDWKSDLISEIQFLVWLKGPCTGYHNNSSTQKKVQIITKISISN